MNERKCCKGVGIFHSKLPAKPKFVLAQIGFVLACEFIPE